VRVVSAAAIRATGRAALAIAEFIDVCTAEVDGSRTVTHRA
jgi:hypothetical protein